MDEGTIQYRMHAELLSRGHKMVAPNVSWSWLSWEADLISVTQAGYWNEFEIKRTLADFIRDFEKPKHRRFAETWKPEPIKHDDPSPYAVRMVARIPNYFWYVAPAEATPPCIPDYAGLIQVTEGTNDKYLNNLKVEYVKKAKMLHGSKLSTEGYTSMLRSVMFKYWDQRKIYYENKREREQTDRDKGRLYTTNSL